MLKKQTYTLLKTYQYADRVVKSFKIFTIISHGNNKKVLLKTEDIIYEKGKETEGSELQVDSYNIEFKDIDTARKMWYGLMEYNGYDTLKDF